MAALLLGLGAGVLVLLQDSSSSQPPAIQPAPQVQSPRIAEVGEGLQVQAPRPPAAAETATPVEALPPADEAAVEPAPALEPQEAGRVSAPPGSRPPSAAIKAAQGRVHNLDDLQREARAFLRQRDGAYSVALYQPGKGFILTINADTPRPLASVVKVEVLLAYLESLRVLKRSVTAEEAALMHSMILRSDNDATSRLWTGMGGNTMLRWLHQTQRLSGLRTSTSWGSTADTPRNIALLLARLANADILDASGRQFALDLLWRVIPDQRWGISAGLNQGLVLIKDGWYPEMDGWRVNSAGIVAGPDRAAAYVLVILTEKQPTMQYGIDTIEGVATLINGFMSHPR